MISSIRQSQDKGKTALQVYLIMRCLANGAYHAHGYRPDDVHVNYKLNIDGTHCHDNAGMKKYILEMVDKGYEHKIIGVTEMDRLFPARFWNKPGQTENLLGLWQDFKLFNQIIWDAHIGSSVDVLLRESRGKAYVPHYDKKTDILYYDVVDKIHMKVYRGFSIPECRKNIFPFYDRWEKSK